MHISVTAPSATLTRPWPSPRRVIDLDAIAANVRRIREVSGTPVMAVVKADAFGHGAIPVARAALRAGATWLGVATIDEALELRRAGITAPVLAWLVDPGCDLVEAVRLGVTVSCANVETLRAVVEARRLADELAPTIGGRERRCPPVDVHLEVDTGMARGGSDPSLWGDLCDAAATAESLGRVVVGGVWSHLAGADNPSPAAIESGLARFATALAEAAAHGLHPTEVHLANTAAALAHPSTRFTLVRSGAGIYGIETVGGRSFGLRAAQRVASRVTQVRDVPAGTPVSYGGGFVTGASSRLALVIGGYADGVPRAASCVTIRGRRLPIVGAITMDQFVVDVGDTRIVPGDEVLLVGGEAAQSMADWARAAETNVHDVLTSLGGRFGRTFVGRTARPTTNGDRR